LRRAIAIETRLTLHLTEEITALDERIAALLAKADPTGILQSMPGVGPTLYAPASGVPGLSTLAHPAGGRDPRRMTAATTDLIGSATGWWTTTPSSATATSARSTPVNLSLNPHARAVASYEDGTYTAVKAIDGNSSSRRSSDHNNDNHAWIYVDLGGVYNVSTVLLSWEQACAKAYKLCPASSAALTAPSSPAASISAAPAPTATNRSLSPICSSRR
jgi:hypothetical protein